MKRNNLLLNGGFENTGSTSEHWPEGVPSNWKLSNIASDGSVIGTYDKSELREGIQSLKMKLTNYKNGYLTATAPATPNKTYVVSFWYKSSDLSYTGENYTIVRKEESKNGTVINASRETILILPVTADWTYVHYKTTIQTTDADALNIVIQLTNNDPDTVKLSGLLWFDGFQVEDYIPATGISLIPPNAEVMVNGGVFIRPVLTPENSNDNPVWSSSNQSIASAMDGAVIGKAIGNTLITASINNLKAECPIIVKTAIPDVYDELRTQWRIFLLPYDYDLSNPSNQAVIDAMVKNARFYSSTINFKEGEKLWIHPSLTTDEAYTNFYDFLKVMANAFIAKGSSLQYDPLLYRQIIDGMEWMHQHLFTQEPSFPITNWWHRDIGMPIAVDDIVILMYDFLPKELIQKYMDRVKFYTPSADETITGGSAFGANRVDKCKAIMVHGIITKDIARFQNVARLLFDESTLGDYVTTGNGYYYDGSMIDHLIYPYAMSYGLVALDGISVILYMIKDKKVENTTITFDELYIERLFKYLEDSYFPLTFKAMVMDDDAGRSVSRQGGSALTRGRGLCNALYLFIENAPESKKEDYLSYLKYWLQHSPVALSGSKIFFNLKFEEILLDSSIIAKAEPTGLFTMNRMTRTYRKTEDFMFAIAMNNNRVAPYECINGENLLGVHTADGMTYLYTSHDQYYGNYHASIDHKRLPGITIDTRPLSEYVAPYTGQTGDSSKRINIKENPKHIWVGASKLENFSAAGFSLDMSGTSGTYNGGIDMDLKANKSWFIFDTKIIALGSDITSRKDRTIETIIENRKLNENGSNTFLVDDNPIDKLQSFDQAKWAFISENAGTKGIGYYFPEPQSLSAEKVLSTGTWKAVNDGGSTEEVSDFYAQLIVAHGINPTDSHYQYVLLPDRTKEETQQYSQNPDFLILAQDAGLHAIKDITSNITAVNNFTKQAVTVEKLTISTSASVLFHERPDGSFKVAVMEPTVQNANTVVVTIQQTLTSVIATDPNVTVTANGNNTVITVQNTENTEFKQNTWYAEFR